MIPLQQFGAAAARLKTPVKNVRASAKTARTAVNLRVTGEYGSAFVEGDAMLVNLGGASVGIFYGKPWGQAFLGGEKQIRRPKSGLVTSEPEAGAGDGRAAMAVVLTTKA